MAQHLKISELRFGLQASPGFQGNPLAPYEIVNIEINDEGRAEMRPGYVVSDQDFTGGGDQLIVIHFVGDRFYSAVSRYQRTARSNVIEIYGRRLFFVGPSGGVNSWHDANTGEAYEWELPKPTRAPTLEVSKGSLSGITGVEVVPNPFVDFLNIRIGVASDVSVKVLIRDFNLEDVKTLELPNVAEVEGHEGYYALDGDADNFYVFNWDGTRDNGREVARGVYYVNVRFLENGEETLYEIQTVGKVSDDEVDPDEEIISGSVESDIHELSDLGDLLPGDGMRRGNYLVCYTYYSSIHGIETPPSPFSQVRIITSTSPDEEKRSPVHIGISDYLDELPRWADQVRLYVKRTGNKTNLTEPKDIPFDFTYIGHVPYNEGAPDQPFSTSYFWSNEAIGDPPGYLETKEFETSPNQSGLLNVLSYAGRLWGYDADLHAIRFSHVDRPDVMPYDDARLIHAIRIDGAWQARVEALHLIPGNGGIFVFFPRAIRTIRGQQIVTGLYTISISPETDIDATGGINGKGTRSPDTIVSYGAMVFYLDTDRRIYALGGGQVLETQEFSLSIQPFLDAATEEEIRNARAEIWQSKYHLMLGSRTYILDMQRNYWTIWDVEITSIAHSVGGDDDEDVLYALVDGDVVELYTGDVPDDTEWQWVSNYLNISQQMRVSEVVLRHPEPVPPEIEIKIETERDPGEWVAHEPSAGNMFRCGTFMVAESRIRVSVRGTGVVPQFNEKMIGVN